MALDSDSKLRYFGVFGILAFFIGVAVLIAGSVFLFRAVLTAREIEAAEKKKAAETQTRVMLRNAVDEYRSQLSELEGPPPAKGEDDDDD
jgi:hypothetical protein